MRKRTIKCAADTFFWYIVYMLPVIGYLIYLFAFGQNPTVVQPGVGAANNSAIVGFGSFLSYMGVTVGIHHSIVYTTLWNIFGVSNDISIFQILSQPMCIFFAYYVATVLVHLVVDFLLFIPRLAHKWMNHFTNTED